MIINRISISELTKNINALGKPEKAGIKKTFRSAGHDFFCESDLKRDCFKLEWKIIEVKGNKNPFSNGMIKNKLV